MKHIIIPNVSNEICVSKRLWLVQQTTPSVFHTRRPTETLCPRLLRREGWPTRCQHNWLSIPKQPFGFLPLPFLWVDITAELHKPAWTTGQPSQRQPQTQSATASFQCRHLNTIPDVETNPHSCG